MAAGQTPNVAHALHLARRNPEVLRGFLRKATELTLVGRVTRAEDSDSKWPAHNLSPGRVPFNCSKPDSDEQRNITSSPTVRKSLGNVTIARLLTSYTCDKLLTLRLPPSLRARACEGEKVEEKGDCADLMGLKVNSASNSRN